MEFKLSNGVVIPGIGFGTWQIKPEDSYLATLNAIKNGYRHIDTAYAYENEEGVGKAVKDSKVKREELFITTKLPSHIKTYDGTIDHFYQSLKNLGLDYIDLYLIHAPWPWSNVGADCKEGNIEAFRAMIDLYNKGLIRSIGVSNFRPENIEPLVKALNFMPHVNQIRFFIGNTQKEVYDYCIKNNILIEAYSPLATGNILNDPTILKMAEKYNVTPAQIAIRYCIEKNTCPLPKTLNAERQKINMDVDFKISSDDIKLLDTIHNSNLDRPLRS